MTKVQKLIVLGLLREKPLHGYQLDQKLKGMGGTLCRIATSTLYSQIKTLEKVGAICRRDVAQQDKPDKKLYTLSPSGIQLFEELIRQVWTEATTDEVGTCLYFLRFLPPAEIHNFLVMRMALLQHVLAAQETLAHMGTFTKDFQALMVAPWDRRVALAAAEMQWVREFYEDYFSQPAPVFELDQPIGAVISTFREGFKSQDQVDVEDSIPLAVGAPTSA
ncbi:MAG TPA: PadR family transcriptional regulator [Candidatus Lokiarchaeia archaeon]|nr:PadR family transcriptional regulator [Candidatus Lokiarchaeia archaeon]